ncbi:hypothetical protein [Mesorhizobium sp. M0088]|uniref:hypothetical protein n=1 Tax=Mesorhizobium sp. M0088 TaxID=2956873 RepID=UPI00333E1386
MPNASFASAAEGLPSATTARVGRRSFIAALFATAALRPAAIEAAGAVASVAMKSRQERIKASIEDLNALLAEETGMAWSIIMLGMEYQTINGMPEMPIIATDPTKYRGLHDPAGIAGPPQQHGKPQCGTWVARREDGPSEGRVTRIPIFASAASA